MQCLPEGPSVEEQVLEREEDDPQGERTLVFFPPACVSGLTHVSEHVTVKGSFFLPYVAVL